MRPMPEQLPGFWIQESFSMELGFDDSLHGPAAVSPSASCLALKRAKSFKSTFMFLGAITVKKISGDVVINWIMYTSPVLHRQQCNLDAVVLSLHLAVELQKSELLIEAEPCSICSEPYEFNLTSEVPLRLPVCSHLFRDDCIST